MSPQTTPYTAHTDAFPTNAMKASSAPPQFPNQAHIKNAMRVDELVIHGDKESNDVAQQATQEAADALMRLNSSSPNNLATPPASSSPAMRQSMSTHIHDAEPARSDFAMSASPEQLTAGERAETASSYAPSASPAAGAAGLPDAEDDIDAAIQSDDDDESGGDPHNREFTCWVHPDCRTKQYTLALSRKMVSDYFGRNKKQTQLVADARWIRACRKHYQRKSYQDSWRTYKGKVVIQQLHRIADQAPGRVAFKVTLKASEERRLSEYVGRLSSADALFDAAAPEARATDDANPDRAPLAVLREIKQFVARRETGAPGEGLLRARDCEELVNRAIRMVKDGRCVRLPLFEMLPQFPDPGKASPGRGRARRAVIEDIEANKPAPRKGGGAAKRKGPAGQGGGAAAKKQKV